MATDSEIRGRVLALTYDLRHSNGGWVPTSEMNFSGPDAVDRQLLGTVCDHLAQSNLIEWRPLRGAQEGFVVGMAKITGRGVDVFEGKVASPIDLVLPKAAAEPSIPVPAAAPRVGATPFEIKVQNELNVEWQRFNNEWLFKWHALGYGGTVEVDAFDGRKIHYGGIKFGNQQQDVFWQAIDRYLNQKVHDYFKRWETETIAYPLALRRSSIEGIEVSLSAFIAKINAISTETDRRLRGNGNPQNVLPYDATGHHSSATGEALKLGAAHRRLLDGQAADTANPPVFPRGPVGAGYNTGLFNSPPKNPGMTGAAGDIVPPPGFIGVAAHGLPHAQQPFDTSRDVSAAQIAAEHRKRQTAAVLSAPGTVEPPKTPETTADNTTPVGAFTLNATAQLGPKPTAGTAPIFVESDQYLPSIDVIPAQSTAASQFGSDEDGRIDLILDPPSLDPIADHTQRDFFEELRHKANDLAGLGHNQLAELSKPVDLFHAALPENIAQVSISRLWSRGNTLRRYLKAHEIVAASGEPDPARLSPKVGELLRDLIDTFNVFIVGDPRGRELDQIRLGPQDRNAAQAALNAALPIVEAVEASKGLATPEAIEALTEQVGAARGAADGIDGDQAIELSRKTTRNFIAQVLRLAYGPIGKMVAAGKTEFGFAWKEVRAGTYRYAGPAGIGAAFIYRQEIIAFIVDNASSLRVFVEQAFHNPELVRIIDLIVQAAAKAGAVM